MTVRVLCRPELGAGFELAGVAVTRAAHRGAAIEAIRQWVVQQEVGVVLVDEELYRALPADFLGRLERRAVPIVAPIPAPRWDAPSEAEAYVVEILRQAIGYRVRPR